MYSSINNINFTSTQFGLPVWKDRLDYSDVASTARSYLWYISNCFSDLFIKFIRRNSVDLYSVLSSFTSMAMQTPNLCLSRHSPCYEYGRSIPKCFSRLLSYVYPTSYKVDIYRGERNMLFFVLKCSCYFFSTSVIRRIYKIKSWRDRVDWNLTDNSKCCHKTFYFSCRFVKTLFTNGIISGELHNTYWLKYSPSEETVMFHNLHEKHHKKTHNFNELQPPLPLLPPRLRHFHRLPRTVLKSAARSKK